VLTLPPAVQIWWATASTDLRRGFDGLASLVRIHLSQDPLSGHLFVFHNKRADRLKILYWDRDGLCIWYKRLERGRFHVPATDATALELTPGQLQMILDGIDLEHTRRYRRYQRPAAG
jgi:transposase